MTTTSTDIQQKLPDGWKWVKLGDVIVERGKSRIKVRDSLLEGKYPFFTSGANIYRSNEFLVEGNNIFVSTGGKAVVNHYDGKASYSTDTYCVTTNKRFECEYLFYFLFFRIDEINSNMFLGAGLKHLQKRQFKNLTIPLPPLNEQKRIANILNEKMAAVEEAKKAAQRRLEAVKALPSAYLRQMFPSSEDELPADWKWVTLGDVCEVVTGNTPSKSNPNYYGGNMPWVGPISLGKDKLVYESELYLSTEGTDVAKVVPAGSVMVTCISSVPHIGKASIAGIPVTTNQQINTLIPTSLIDSTFVLYSVATVRPIVQTMAKQSINQAIVNKSQLSSVSIPLPPLGEQKRIASQLDDKLAGVKLAEESIQQELDTIEAMPAALLRKAFRGEL